MRVHDEAPFGSRLRPLEIAIIGSGITSNCIAVGLQHCPNLNITVYEAKDHFVDEDGQNFGLGSHTLQALQLIHPSVRSALYTAGGTSAAGIVLKIATGPDAGAVIAEATFPDGLVTIVRRGHLVKEVRGLLDDPAAVTKLGKRLVRIKETMGIRTPRYKLLFEDGTVAHADAVIGGDGVNSFTRSYVLGEHDPATYAKRTDTVSIRRLLPRARAVQVFGEDFCAWGGQRVFMGDGGLIWMSWSDNYQTVEVIVELLRAGWPYPDDVIYHAWDHDRFIRDVKPYGWIGDRVIDIFLPDPNAELVAGTRKIHLGARTWVNGGVCIAGDAAGAFQPHAGNGANQSIQDALALVTVLKSVTTPEEVHNALGIYQFWRKGLRDAAGVESEETAVRMSGLSPMGLDVKKLREYYRDSESVTFV